MGLNSCACDEIRIGRHDKRHENPITEFLHETTLDHDGSFFHSFLLWNAHVARCASPCHLRSNICTSLIETDYPVSYTPRTTPYPQGLISGPRTSSRTRSGLSRLSTSSGKIRERHFSPEFDESRCRQTGRFRGRCTPLMSLKSDCRNMREGM